MADLGITTPWRTASSITRFERLVAWPSATYPAIVRAMTTGGCFCGAVRYEAGGPFTGVTYCHCSKCRKWHGHAGAYTAVDRTAFRFVEQRGLKWHEVSPAVRRGFCVECGSSLFFDEPGHAKLSLCPGSLDAPTGVREKAHIYIHSKGDYYEIPEDGLLRYDAI